MPERLNLTLRGGRGHGLKSSGVLEYNMYQDLGNLCIYIKSQRA